LLHVGVGCFLFFPGLRTALAAGGKDIGYLSLLSSELSAPLRFFHHLAQRRGNVHLGGFDNFDGSAGLRQRERHEHTTAKNRIVRLIASSLDKMLWRERQLLVIRLNAFKLSPWDEA
jgi:hypothetical protein